ncbi:hypothetical protein [Massilia sp. 9096]|uniref:hypothetical protein n=1 Tax=Massilia sp. 9096 TaxID=1500894 RepID=UPI00068BBFD8|nr:hypothetical protein [Massilia sp. 9096]
MKFNVIPAPEVAYKLRMELGPDRAWEDALADMRRGKTKVQGCTLLPKCMGKHRGAWRPMYAVPDVEAFIEAVRKATPGTVRGVPHLVKTAHTLPGDTRPWYTRKLLVARSTFTPTAGYLAV